MLAVPAWVRYLITAVVLGVIGYLVDAYLPVQPLAHIIAIVLYIGAVIAVLFAILTLLRAPSA